MLEGVWYLKQNNRMSLGFRGQLEYIHTFSGSKELPIFEKLFLGGEYSIRGFDIRTVGPQDPQTGLVLGGNKSVLFNVEELINIAGPVRLDAVLRRRPGRSRGPRRLGPAAFTAEPVSSTAPTVASRQTLQHEGLQDVDGRRDPLLHAGAERPVPADLRLQSAARRRAGQQLQPQKAFQFRFAVGSTF